MVWKQGAYPFQESRNCRLLVLQPAARIDQIQANNASDSGTFLSKQPYEAGRCGVGATARQPFKSHKNCKFTINRENYTQIHTNSDLCVFMCIIGEWIALRSPNNLRRRAGNTFRRGAVTTSTRTPRQVRLSSFLTPKKTYRKARRKPY